MPLLTVGAAKFQRLHKFHARFVTKPVPGFKYLAPDQEISLSESNRILTMQAHPEMTGQIARDIIAVRDPSYFPDPTPEGMTKLCKDLDAEHDGREVFARALTWAFDVQE